MRPLATATLLLAVLPLAACRSTTGDSAWTDLTWPEAWRAYQGSEPPASWSFHDGLVECAQPGGTDLVTRESFASFELELEWRIAPGGNSGILFHVQEDQPASYMTGPEMQVLDDAAFAGREELDPRHRAGADYALYAPEVVAVRPAGEWNAVRLVVRGPEVESWLNGEPQCRYELWSADWNARVAASKFAAWPGFGRALEGHLALQDHGAVVAYRRLRIRRL